MLAGMDIDVYGQIDYVFIKDKRDWKLINIKYAGSG